MFKLPKLPSPAEAFHALYEAVDWIDSQLTPRPPLEVTIQTPINASILATVAAAMADALTQIHPHRKVTVNLPPNVQSTPVVIQGVQAHAERSDIIEFIATIRGLDSDAFMFGPVEDNGHNGVKPRN